MDNYPVENKNTHILIMGTRQVFILINYIIIWMIIAPDRPHTCHIGTCQQ